MYQQTQPPIRVIFTWVSHETKWNTVECTCFVLDPDFENLTSCEHGQIQGGVEIRAGFQVCPRCEVAIGTIVPNKNPKLNNIQHAHVATLYWDKTCWRNQLFVFVEFLPRFQFWLKRAKLFEYNMHWIPVFRFPNPLLLEPFVCVLWFVRMSFE